MGNNIKIEVPEWAKERRWYVFAGRECMYIREPSGQWYRKTVRCNLCGKCCMDVNENWSLGVKEMDGKTVCQHLKKAGKEYLCQAGGIAPFACSKTSVWKKIHPDCVEEFEKVEVE